MEDHTSSRITSLDFLIYQINKAKMFKTEEELKAYLHDSIDRSTYKKIKLINDIIDYELDKVNKASM